MTQSLEAITRLFNLRALNVIDGHIYCICIINNYVFAFINYITGKSLIDLVYQVLQKSVKSNNLIEE